MSIPPPALQYADFKSNNGPSTDKLHRLLQCDGSLFIASSSLETNLDEPRMTIKVTRAGNMTAVFPWVVPRGSLSSWVYGAGAGIDEHGALIPALAEGLERYCASVCQPEQCIRASANELGSAAIDLDSIPRCSLSELTHPKCPLIVPDKHRPIRWVSGISAHDGRVVTVPAVMVYIHPGLVEDSERFWIPISTGCAAHVSYERALMAAIYEVIERDALSIAWLQKLALPRVDVDIVPTCLAPYWERYEQATRDITYHFFDATTDLGVPTVLGIQTSPHNKDVSTLVSCSTATNMAEAVAKAIRDMSAIRCTFRTKRAIPDCWDDFTDLLHGATLMAMGSSADAFNFLIQTKANRRLSSYAGPNEATNALKQVLCALRRKGLDTYVIDLSLDEAILSGMRVLRVLIPGLQPISFRYRARYLGHTRLYHAPECMGYPVLPEAQLNHWPLPFA
jgi:ribosomal protein S12 methylthiotransferase accessory factor